MIYEALIVGERDARKVIHEDTLGNLMVLVRGYLEQNPNPEFISIIKYVKFQEPTTILISGGLSSEQYFVQFEREHSGMDFSAKTLDEIFKRVIGYDADFPGELIKIVINPASAGYTDQDSDDFEETYEPSLDLEAMGHAELCAMVRLMALDFSEEVDATPDELISQTYAKVHNS